MTLILRRISVVALALVLLLTSLSASCAPEPMDPQPFQDVEELLESETYFWLYSRITSPYQLEIIQDEDAGWRDEKTLDGFVGWWPTVFGNAHYWNFQPVVDSVKSSYLYPEEGLLDEWWLGIIGDEIDAFELQSN